MSWEMLIEESQEGVADVGSHSLAKWRVKPDDVSFPVLS